jgi:hypothetical protein
MVVQMTDDGREDDGGAAGGGHADDLREVMAVQLMLMQMIAE